MSEQREGLIDAAWFEIERRIAAEKALFEARSANVRLQEALASDPMDQSAEIERLRRELAEAQSANKRLKAAYESELAEARAALWEVPLPPSPEAKAWMVRHAAALKAAWEVKS